MAGWESLWQGLLWEAARRASPLSRQEEIETTVVARSAAAIILARGAWEAYLNEFIEWRKLSPNLKNQSCYEGISGVHNELGREFDSGEEIWDNLLLLNTLRNKIIHHKAGRFQPGQGPWEIAERLARLGLINLPRQSSTWEKALLSDPIARWSCQVVADSIIELESIPTRRTRSFSEVKTAVYEAIKPLDQHKRN